MISWIQRSFQHHFRLIFALLLIGMVVPFIFTIGSTPGIGGADHKTLTRNFFGYDLASREVSQRILEDGRVSAELQFGPGASAEQVESYSYHRIAALHLADEMRIPAADPSELTDFIKHLRIFAGSDGAFDVARYDQFRSNIKLSGAVSEADIARVLSDDVRVQKIEPLLAGPGFVLPSDVISVITKFDTSWTISTASVDYASFDPGISLTDADISKYFSDNIFRYTVAPRISVDCIEFPAAPYLAQIAPPTDAEVREFYDANPRRFPKPANAKASVGTPDPEADFAAVKPQVRATLQLDVAKRSAIKAGSDVEFALYDGKVSRGALDAFLADRKLKLTSVAPFTLEAGPTEFGGSHDIAAAAFGLNADRYYSDALPSPSGAVVLIWRELLPAHEPALVEVRDKVRADALDNEKRKRFVDFGRMLKAGIERRLKDGEPFEKAAVEAGGTTPVVVKAYPAFTLQTRPHDIDEATIGILDRLSKGSVSDMEATADSGTIVYAADKAAPSVDETSSRYGQIRAQMQQAVARSDAVAILGDVVDRELKKSEAGPK
jgi:peptidyl-prolyl cis-trans isomerase D